MSRKCLIILSLVPVFSWFLFCISVGFHRPCCLSICTRDLACINNATNRWLSSKIITERGNGLMIDRDGGATTVRRIRRFWTMLTTQAPVKFCKTLIFLISLNFRRDCVIQSTARCQPRNRESRYNKNKQMYLGLIILLHQNLTIWPHNLPLMCGTFLADAEESCPEWVRERETVLFSSDQNTRKIA